MATAEQIKKLRDKLTVWDDYYHNTSKSLVDDEEYNSAVDLLKKWSPDDLYFRKVGAPVRANKDKVHLRYKMPSLSKVRENRGLEKWLEESSGDIAALDKLDGSSAMIEQYDEQKMFSRGNGTIGRDISRLLKHVKGIPKQFTKNGAVRGELMMSKEKYKRWVDEYDNERALVNGAVNSSKSIHPSAKDILFIAHEYVNPKTSWERARIRLKGEGFTTAVTKRFKNPSPADLLDYFKERQHKTEYPLDGIVLIDLKTGDKVSMKVDAVPVKIIVDHVEYNISQNGIYKPRVVFKTPIRIGGTTVSYATAHNARYVVTHKIGPGAILKVIKSGDVIPKVVGTIKGVTPQLPDNFEWDSNKVEALATDLTANEERTMTAKRLVSACVVLQIEGIKMGTAIKLYDAGIEDINDLLHASIRTLEASGIGKVVSSKTFQYVQAIKKRATHAMLMEASGLWPKGYTEDKFILILTDISYKDIITRYKNNKIKLRSDIASIKGMSTASATIFLKSLARYHNNFLKNIAFKPKSDIVEKIIRTGKLTGEQICFTKIRDEDTTNFIVENGGKVVNRINKDTTKLIVPSKIVNSSKVDAAKELKITIITLADFKKQYRI